MSKTPTSAAPRTVSVLARIQGARDVVLTGEFTGWAKDGIRMRKIAADQWRAEFRLPPGMYQYRLLVDGEWKNHPEAVKQVPNSFGTQNCVLSVPG